VSLYSQILKVIYYNSNLNFMIKANKNNGGEGDIDVNDSFVANERRAQ
jgi:hypothetical protein